MLKQKVIMKNPMGLHLDPAGLFCKTAVQFDSKITFEHKNSTSNAKSVLSVLGAGIKLGDEIEIICEGADEELALKTMVELVESGLEE